MLTQTILIIMASVGIGVPVGKAMNGSPIDIGLLCGGLDVLLSLIFS